MSSSMDSDQKRHFVEPGLGQNCLNGFKQVTRVRTCREKVKKTRNLMLFENCCEEDML